MLSHVEFKELRLIDAAELIRVSSPQAKRLWKRYREEGPAALRHRACTKKGTSSRFCLLYAHTSNPCPGRPMSDVFVESQKTMRECRPNSCLSRANKALSSASCLRFPYTVSSVLHRFSVQRRGV